MPESAVSLGTGLTPWSRLLATTRLEPGRASLDIPPDWLQGRTVFGGLQAAVALQAMRSLVPAAPLRTLQGTFLAPVPAGRITATARVLRTGKSATHVEGRLVDGDATLALFVAVFGAARASRVRIMPRRPQVETGQPNPFVHVAGTTPEFTRHFSARWLRGLPPFTADVLTEHVIEIGMRDAGPASEGHVLAMADFIPPIALSHLTTPAPGSTLTWMLELLTDRIDTLGLDGWRIDAQLVAAADGYTSQSVMLWGPDGEPVAMGHQNMVVFG